MAEVDDEHVENEIKEIFDYFDKDGSGEIDSDELKDCLKCLGENVVDEEVNDMIAAMDIDGDGTISFVEFLKEMKKRYGKRDVQDSSSFITKEGVMHVMNTIFKENMTIDEAEDMIKVVGGDKGYVTFEEFRKVMLEGV